MENPAHRVYIVYVTRTVMKAQALADQLAENLVDISL